MRLKKFDYQINDNKKNKSVLFLGIGVLLLVTVFIIYKSFAAYKVTQTYNIIKGSVVEFTQEKLKISYNLVGEDGGIMSTDQIPSSNEYEFDKSASKCVNGTEIVYDADNNTITIDENAEDVCTIYFNFIPFSTRTLYALGYTLDEIKTGIPYGPDAIDDPSVSGFYAAEDDYGTSYYYYVHSSEFPPVIMIGDYIYYIIRINGNGTIRLINLDQFMTYTFNQYSNDNAYVGFMFGQLNSEVANINSSYIKTRFPQLVNYDLSYFDDTLFCNDRSLYMADYGQKESDDTVSGIGTNTTYYGAYYRLRNNSPTLKCPNKRDAFTVEDTTYGNGALDIPVGLITADEAYMTNLVNWYYHNYYVEIMTMTPVMFKDGKAQIYTVSSDIVNKSVDVDGGINAEVLNLKAGLKFSERPEDIWGMYEIIE